MSLKEYYSIIILPYGVCVVMNFKKIISFILLLVVVFGLCKNLFVSYAAENSGYVILLNNDSAPISFAGMKYTVDSDLKSVSVEFQMTDTHLFKGQQGVILTVICGDQRDTVHIDVYSPTDADSSFFSLNNVYTQVNTYDSHTNVKINFKLSLDEKLKDKLLFKMQFTDAEGALSKEVYYILYSPDETTEKTTKPKDSTTHKLTESSNDNRQTSGLSLPNSKEHNYKFPDLGNSYSNYYNDAEESQFSSSQHDSGIFSNNFNDTTTADMFSDKNDAFGLQQIVAIILSISLVAAAVVCIIIGIKRNKVT